jgi:hypothetical protein
VQPRQQIDYQPFFSDAALSQASASAYPYVPEKRDLAGGLV